MAATEPNWLKSIQGKSFADISVAEVSAAADGSVPINTAEFLRAAESLVTLFDILGSYKFKAVIDDLNGNIAKVKARMLAAPAESETLQDLVLNELKTGKHTATEGLLWLGRGLDFTVQSLRHNLDNPSTELNASFTTAYGNTLSNYHGWIVKKAFNFALGYCPKRVIFYRQLADKNYKEGDAAQDSALDAQVQAEVMPALEKEIQALERVVKNLQAFQATPEASKWQKK